VFVIVDIIFHFLFFCSAPNRAGVNPAGLNPAFLGQASGPQVAGPPLRTASAPPEQQNIQQHKTSPAFIPDKSTNTASRATVTPPSQPSPNAPAVSAVGAPRPSAPPSNQLSPSLPAPVRSNFIPQQGQQGFVHPPYTQGNFRPQTGFVAPQGLQPPFPYPIAAGQPPYVPQPVVFKGPFDNAPIVAPPVKKSSAAIQIMNPETGKPVEFKGMKKCSLVHYSKYFFLVGSVFVPCCGGVVVIFFFAESCVENWGYF
jgi:hypothetical protein